MSDVSSGIDLATTLDALCAQAAEKRDNAWGNRVTFSPKVFIPLTKLCRDRCRYCTFAQPPARVAAPYLSLAEVIAIARAGADAGAHEALFTLGERPELRYPVAADWLAEHGYSSTVDYLVAAAAAVREETGMLAHANAGAMSAEELSALRRVSASQGMMIETLVADLAAHAGSPDKQPGRRLATLEAAGRLAIPFTTGILVGIGETRRDRLDALEAIAASQRAHGHVQEVIVQNFVAKPGTAMHAAPSCDMDDYLWTVAAARVILPAEVHLQAPPNLSDDYGRLLDAGIDDWGGISAVTADHVNPERPWPAIERLEAVTEGRGYHLAPRMTIYPEFATDAQRWLDESMRSAVLKHSDAQSLGRDTDGWCAGGEAAAPLLIEPSPDRGRVAGRVGGRIGEILDGVRSGQEAGVDELAALFGARGSEVTAVAGLADRLRYESVGDTVTFVINRNINYTNVCTFKCRFCAFSKGPLSLNLRGEPYLLGMDEITDRVVEAELRGATEVCLQGGIHPSFDGNHYIEVIKAVRAASPSIHIHGFTALEVTEGARRLDEPLRSYLTRLRDAGLRTLPGTAAEILDDEVRAVLCPDKVNTEEWLYAHRCAHEVGLNSNVTIMFGAVERPLHWARHLVRTRELQRETGGFTEFVPLPFVHMATPIYLQGRSRKGPTFREAILMHAVGRIAYRGLIDNIQASWVKLGRHAISQLLAAGCNDLGGTLMDENISRAAGARHGQLMEPDDFAALVAPLGRRLVQRTTLYGTVEEQARPGPTRLVQQGKPA